MFWNGWLLYVPMCQIKENRWSDTMVITATYLGVNGGRRTKMILHIPFWNLTARGRSAEKIGQDWFKRFTRLIPPPALKCSGAMRVISVIEDEDVIKNKKSSQATETIIDYSDSQLQSSDVSLISAIAFPMATKTASILIVNINVDMISKIWSRWCVWIRVDEIKNRLFFISNG